VLVGAGATVATSLAGCSMLGDGSTPAAVSVGGTASCDVCDMVISKHPGPNGQIFYADHDPEDHDPPFRFDSLKSCAFDHYFRKKRQDWSVDVFYVTDYSSVDYSISEEGGKSFISGHENPESFATAKSVSYVVDADVYGAMGTDFVPFSDEDEASDFAEEYGGKVVSFGDISPATLK
jgi:nitrous oxide reductase accessory protein NosL